MPRPKKENANEFIHDRDMRDDPKIRSLRSRYGLIGYAIWNMLLEVLTNADGFCLKWDGYQLELLSGDFGIAAQDLDNIINHCHKLRLVQIRQGVLFCEKLNERLNPILKRRSRNRNSYKNKTQEPVSDARNDKELPPQAETAISQESVSDARNDFGRTKPPLSVVSDARNGKNGVSSITYRQGSNIYNKYSFINNIKNIIPKGIIEKEKNGEGVQVNPEIPESPVEPPDFFPEPSSGAIAPGGKQKKKRNFERVIEKDGKTIKVNAELLLGIYRKYNRNGESNVFPDVRKMDDQLRKKCTTRFMRNKDDLLKYLGDFAESIRKAKASSFINSSNFFDFRWLVENDSNMNKVLEGKYDDKKPANSVTTNKPETARIFWGRSTNGK